MAPSTEAPTAPVAGTPTGAGVVLVCSGGGLHGAAQAGMLAELFEAGFSCSAIVGVSAGACNGLYLAADPTAQGAARLCEVWRSLEASAVFPTTKRAQFTGLFAQRGGQQRQENFRQVVRDHLPVSDLAECQIPVHVGTVDVHTGEPVWFSSGPALDIVVASAALPGVFPPVQIGDRLLYDGGVAHALPLEQAVELAPTALVTLDVTKSAPSAPVSSQFQTLRRGMDHTREALRRAQLAAVPTGIHVCVVRSDQTTFTSLHDEVELGRAAMRAHLAEHPLRELVEPVPLRSRRWFRRR